MLNEEKVRYMTGLAIFEKNEGRKIFPINRYFKKDYVGGQMFRSFFGYTFCYLLMLLCGPLQTGRAVGRHEHRRTA